MPNASTGDLTVCCHVVERSLVNDRKPLLRRLLKKTRYFEFANKIYIPVTRRAINLVKVYILNETGEEVSFPRGRSSCTLHFSKRK